MRAGKVRVPPWLDLEPGIWQMVFESLEGSDKRCMRLVCRHFNSLASQTIRTLDVRLLLEGCRIDEVPMLLLPMARKLPGSFQAIECIMADQDMCGDHACSLGRFSRLQRLKLCGSEVPPLEAMQIVSSLRSLRKLHLHRFSLRDPQTVACLHSLSLLTHLELSKCTPVNAEVMSLVGQLTGLSALELTKPFSFRDQGYSALGRLTNLSSLKLGYSWTLGTGDESLGFFSCLRKLQHVNICKCFVNDASLAPLAALTNLQLLGLLNCSGITGTVFEELKDLVQLQGLTLQGSNKITDKGVMHIACITSLRALHLGSSHDISPAACKSNLVHLTNLARLKVPLQVAEELKEDAVKALLPSLVSYTTSPRREVREPGAMEERLRLTAGFALPDNAPMVERLFHWFHTGQVIR